MPKKGYVSLTVKVETKKLLDKVKEEVFKNRDLSDNEAILLLIEKMCLGVEAFPHHKHN